MTLDERSKIKTSFLNIAATNPKQLTKTPKLAHTYMKERLDHLQGPHHVAESGLQFLSPCSKLPEKHTRGGKRKANVKLHLFPKALLKA